MKFKHNNKVGALLLVINLIVFGSVTSVLGEEDPLPSWNEGEVKRSIIEFVESVTDVDSEKYVKTENRVASLDLDGTLLCEYPVNFQRSIAIKRLKELVSKDVSLKEVQPFKAAWEGDSEFYNHPDNHSFVFLRAFKDCPHEDYGHYVRDYLKSEQSEYWGKSFKELFYKPGLELIRYLEDRGFEIYICSTTEEECIRVLLSEVMEFHPIQVIGNEVELQFQDGVGDVSLFMKDSFKLPENRKEGKCLHLSYHIGKRPIFAYGNTGGDVAMLKYASSNKLPNLVLVLDHDDNEREMEYHDEEILEKAQLHKWKVISMKRDFKKIFLFEE